MVSLEEVEDLMKVESGGWGEKQKKAKKKELKVDKQASGLLRLRLTSAMERVCHKFAATRQGGQTCVPQNPRRKTKKDVV